MSGKFDLQGRRAIVTGGARGIGAAIVRALAGAGVRVAIADLDLAAALALAEAVGGGAAAFEIDVRDRTSTGAAFDAALAHLGALDILAANAGVSTMRRAIDLTDEDWAFNMDVNARGIFLSNQIACRYFLGERARRRDRQHGLARREGRRAAARALFGEQVRGAGLDSGAGARNGAASRSG